MNKNDRARIPALFLLIAISGLGAWLRFYRIGALSFWLDEAYTAVNARGSLLHTLKADPNMSLYNIFAYFWVRVLPDASDGALRSISAVFSILGIPVVFLLGRALLPDRRKSIAAGLIAALWIALHGYHVQYAQEFRSYSLVCLLLSLSTLLLIKTVENPGSRRIWPLGYTLVSAAAVYAHFLAGFGLAAQWVSLAIFLGDRRKYARVLRRMLVCISGVAVLILPAVYAALHRGSGQISWIKEPTLQTVLIFLVEISGKQGLWLVGWSIALAVVGFSVGLAVWSPRDLVTKWKFTLLMGAFFLPAAAGLLISKFLLPIFVPYYFQFVVPFLAVLAAAGVVAISDFSAASALFRKLSPLIAGLVFAFWMLFTIKGLQKYYLETKKEDWRAAAGYLSAHCADALRLYYPPFMEINAIYYNAELLSQEAGWWRAAIYAAQPQDEIAASFPQGYQKVCLGIRNFNPPQLEPQAARVHAALLELYPHETGAAFYQAQVIIFTREAEPSQTK